MPCHLRYTEANTLLAGILPGPRKPKGSVNTYLEPLVNNLIEFWSPTCIRVLKNVHVVHYCVCTVIHLCHKACGFLSHSAHFGSNKCKKVFSGGVGQKDYSGFDRERWTYRSNEIHHADALKLLHYKTKRNMSLHLGVVILFYSTLTVPECLLLILCTHFFCV